ncbi:MAG: HAMP domain-containing histidine kinase [Chloroflexi bacterium]|nr:HAMP domain-containing histidine kinase [Chloroflexota bacterium]
MTRPVARPVIRPAIRAAGSRPRVIGRGFRRRLVLTLVALVGLTAAVLAAGAYVFVTVSLRDQLVRTSVGQAQFNIAVLAQDQLSARPTADEVARSGLADAFRVRGNVETFVEFGDGNPFVSGLAFRTAPDLFSVELTALVADDRIAFQWLTVDADPYLVVGGRRQPAGPDFYFFFPAQPLEDALTRLAQGLVGGVVIALLLALVAAGAIARGVLRPVQEASVAAGRIERGDLTARVPTGAPDEFGRWAAAFNRMAASLEQTVQQLREAQAQQRRFVADVSHELRTPITALVNEATLIAERSAGASSDPDTRRLGELLVRDVARLRTLVDDLLEVSRLDAAVDPVDVERVELARFVRTLVTTRLPGATVTVQGRTRAGTNGGPEPLIWVETDRRGLERIVGNLLDNAREHAAGRGVDVELGRSRDVVQLRVSDRGPGVRTVDLPRLFDRFFKADPSRGGGTSGLGLAIAREHAQRLGGTLRASLREGGGLTVSLLLPVTRSLPAGDPRVTPDAQSPVRAAAMPPPDRSKE